MIITGYEQYNSLIERMSREQCILTPIFRDIHYHRVENNILCIGVSFPDETYVISVSHRDAPTFDVPGAPHLTSEDVQILAYVHGISPIEWSYAPYIVDTHNQFWNVRDVNRLIPLTTWASLLKTYATQQWNIVNAVPQNVTYEFVRNMIHTLRQIENAGLCVNREILSEHFETKTLRTFKHNFVYSEYNPYTITGRPSNRFGGINFSALNKTDGSRDAFISRYENGTLVQIDFEAYHLRLVADDFNIQLPSSSLHTELAKQYFKTEHITEQLYADSKRKTFEIMYGMSDETHGIDLFNQIVEIRKAYRNTSDKLELPSGVIVDVTEPNPSKLFNYYVQSLEVVKTIPKLQLVIDLLQNTTNHLVLYTYDSILLDMETFDSSIVKKIVSILEEEKKFPVRVYKGTTYGNISETWL